MPYWISTSKTFSRQVNDFLDLILKAPIFELDIDNLIDATHKKLKKKNEIESMKVRSVKTSSPSVYKILC